MSVTPVEIRHVKLRKRLAGYDRRSVDRLLDEVTASFEAAWRERADLRDDVERLGSEVSRFRELEALLRKTLVSAERAAEDVKAQAKREAELTIEAARVKAQEILGTAESERERLRVELRRLRALEDETRAEYRAFLVAALERLDAQGARQAPGRAA